MTGVMSKTVGESVISGRDVFSPFIAKIEKCDMLNKKLKDFKMLTKTIKYLKNKSVILVTDRVIYFKVGDK